MTSNLKQISANRENSKHSTGPRTEEGKRRASQNAVKHGLNSFDFLLDIESEDDYHLFHEQLIHDHQPRNGTDYILIEQYLQAYFLKRRFLQKMPDLYRSEKRQYSNETLISYPVLMKMINQADRMLYRALDRLQEIAKERVKEAKQAAQSEAALPKPAAKQNKIGDLPEFGFVLSPFQTRDPRRPLRRRFLPP